MRAFSNKESLARREVSMLAIVETVAAIALLFSLSIHFNTMRWLSAAICVAPLLLLRTPQSTERGIRWFDQFSSVSGIAVKRIGTTISTGGKPINLFLGGTFEFVAQIIAYPCFLLVVPFVVRFLATLVSVCKDPLSSLQKIPENWSRMILSVDVCFAPEIVPEHPSLNIDAMRTDARMHSATESGPLFDFIDRCIAIFFYIELLPAVAYRWSLKATALIYAPLVFVAHSTFHKPANLRAELEVEKESDLSRVRTIYAILFIASFAMKCVLMFEVEHFAEWWNKHAITRFLALYVAPEEIPKWHVAGVANCFLILGVTLFVRHALLRIKAGSPWPEVRVYRILGFLHGVRWVLVSYEIACAGYITLRAAHNWQLPRLGTRWFPWQ